MATVQSESVASQLGLTQDELVQTFGTGQNQKQQPEGTSCHQFSPVLDKFLKPATSCSPGSPNLGSKTGLNWTFKHYTRYPPGFCQPVVIPSRARPADH